jgi:microcystin-dependent protein
MLCDGRPVLRGTYPELFGVVGTTYGVGDGSTTFNLPDLRSRTIIGAGPGSGTAPALGAGLTARTLNSSGGEELHRLNTTEIPSHPHGVGSLANTTVGDHAHAISNNPSYPWLPAHDSSWQSVGIPITSGPVFVAALLNTPNMTYVGTTANGGAHGHTISGSTSPVGGDGLHENMPPWVAVSFIIKVTGAQINPGGALVGPAGPTGAAGAAGATGATGTPGSKWYDGSGNPNSSLGVVGDYYLDDNSGVVWTKASGGWQSVAGLHGTPIWKNDWSSGFIYSPGDAVAYQGQSWVANQSAQGAGGSEPGGTFGLWILMAGKGANGATGATGPAGATGATGPGVPVGGSTGQVLAKKTATDYDTNWVTAAAGGGSSAGHTIQEEGVSLTARSKLNFVGSTVTAQDDPANDATLVTVLPTVTASFAAYQVTQNIPTGTVTSATGWVRQAGYVDDTAFSISGGSIVVRDAGVYDVKLNTGNVAGSTRTYFTLIGPGGVLAAYNSLNASGTTGSTDTIAATVTLAAGQSVSAQGYSEGAAGNWTFNLQIARVGGPQGPKGDTGGNTPLSRWIPSIRLVQPVNPPLVLVGVHNQARPSPSAKTHLAR